MPQINISYHLICTANLSLSNLTRITLRIIRLQQKPQYLSQYQLKISAIPYHVCVAIVHHFYQVGSNNNSQSIFHEDTEI